jgi:signal transduction histidine kinase
MSERRERRLIVLGRRASWLRNRVGGIATPAGGLDAPAADSAEPMATRRPLPRRPRFDLSGLSLAGRYLVLSFVFVVVGGGIVAYALGQLIETSAVSRTTSVTALYVQSFVAPELQSLATNAELAPTEIAALQRLLTDSPLSQTIVSIRVWSLDGRILYSPLPELVGRQFDMTGERGQSAQGAVIGDISDLSDPENVYEHAHWDHLIEIYLPVRATGTSRIIAVAELYQLPDEVEAEVNRDRLIAWGLVAGATVLAYLALVRVVRQGSETIVRQEGELRRQVDELSTLLGQNERLHDRIRQAAARTTALTELERRRIGSDLHDGPSQTLAFAMLRLDAVEGRLEAAGQAGDSDLIAVRGALDEALHDMRTIAAGLRTPELEQAKPAEIVQRAVADHERRSGTRAAVNLRGIPSRAPLATKIAMYRVLSEALSNAARHGGAAGVAVRVTGTDDGWLAVEVSDTGPGFESRQDPGAGHLGLAGMRERAELLGGRFELESGPGTGTRVRVLLPLTGLAGDEP